MAYSESDKSKLKAFGLTVKRLREEKGLSQMELSFRADLDRTYIGSLERGHRNVSILNLLKIADALDVHISTLFEWPPKE